LGEGGLLPASYGSASHRPSGYAWRSPRDGNVLSPLFHKGVPEEGKNVFRARLVARFSHLDRHLRDNEYLMGTEWIASNGGLSEDTEQL
jgi:glutathione S-transferase